jgi:hypothetical protein
MNTPMNLPTGETLSGPDRLIVAPSTGVFRPLVGEVQKPGHAIERGDIVGEVRSLNVCTVIRSPFAGVLIDVLAVAGERLRPGQPVAWLRIERSVSAPDDMKPAAFEELEGTGGLPGEEVIHGPTRSRPTVVIVDDEGAAPR